MPSNLEGWVQINFRAPESWKKAAAMLQEKLKANGELISYEEACRRLYRKGAETEDVWSEVQGNPRSS